jgi:hypothetical protein
MATAKQKGWLRVCLDSNIRLHLHYTQSSLRPLPRRQLMGHQHQIRSYWKYFRLVSLHQSTVKYILSKWSQYILYWIITLTWNLSVFMLCDPWQKWLKSQHFVTDHHPSPSLKMILFIYNLYFIRMHPFHFSLFYCMYIHLTLLLSNSL